LIGSIPHPQQLGRIRLTLRVESNQDAIAARKLGQLDAQQRIDRDQVALDCEAKKRFQIAHKLVPHGRVASVGEPIIDPVRVRLADALDRARA
jgi:hypothetical protein